MVLKIYLTFLQNLGISLREEKEKKIMGSVRIDPYFYKQPSLSFVESLKKPVHEEKPEWFGRTQLREGEVSVWGLFLVNNFPDEQKLLETAIEDFELFLEVHGARGDRFPVKLIKAETECFEAYRVYVEKDFCVVEAGDTEGIRRALVYLEDEMLRREGAILPLGKIVRKPVIRERITRGFFSPTNRPPKNIDELMDDVDYYPDEYLNRLAHDGTNGLWIYTYFNQLLTSDCFTEYGKDSAKRIAKLKRVVEKCKRYGVKVWIFGVEPFALAPEIAANYPDSTGGIGWNGHKTVCTYSELGAKYCIEATQRLMEQVPDLGGIIDITYGERPTTCASLDDYCQCPRCRQHSRSEIIAHNIDLLKEGIRRAGSKADFVSWTYAHRESTMEEIQEYVRKAPSDVMLQENFEDNGYVEQLGKTRQAMDYWLSYTGPSQMFEGAAQTALEEGKHMFAKMQVCCSHELATVPYIPVPGILFDKYAAAHRYRVEGVMQCWYFGNYPSLMSKAAGELSFMEDFSDKKKFLTQLAGIYYGGRAKEAVTAWEHFEKGYQNYPVNIMFSYYGPMHDGVVWELALEPKDASLPRSWQLMDKPDGDRIGECLQCGHTLREAVVLTERMREEWKAGVDCLPDNGPLEQRTVVEALKLLLASGNNIMRFYELRDLLAKGNGDACTILREMEDIVEEEMRHSLNMIPLCEADSRLGYHSEAEGYKFFPEKLLDRVEKLKVMQEEEFDRVRKRITEGKPALAWYLGEKGPGYQMTRGWESLAEGKFEQIGDQDAAFRVAYDEKMLYVELKGQKDTSFRMHFEYELMWPSPGVIIEGGEKRLSRWATSHQSIWGEKIQQELEKYKLVSSEPEEGHYIVAIPREKVGWTENKPLRVMIAANDVSWIYDDDPVHLLGKNDISPGEFGWLWV